MIHTGLPQRIPPLHPVVTNQGIHDRVLEGMTHVECAGDVWRRDHDAIGFTVAAGLEVTVFLPAPVLPLLYIVRIVGLIHVGASRPPEILDGSYSSPSK